MKTKVKLGLAKMSVPQLTGYANHVVSEVKDNLYFPAPSPDLSRIKTAITKLEDAYKDALGAGPPQTAVMNQCREALELLLSALGNYVEGVANDPVNVEAGANTVILSAGMDVKSISRHQKRTFSVSYGNIPGTMELSAASVTRGSHEWRYTTDVTSVSGWINVDATVQASTIIEGLEIGKKHYFSHRAITPDGPTDWDDPESLTVV